MYFGGQCTSQKLTKGNSFAKKIEQHLSTSVADPIKLFLIFAVKLACLLNIEEIQMLIK
jgi:hypothetical protein